MAEAIDKIRALGIKAISIAPPLAGILNIWTCAEQRVQSGIIYVSPSEY